MSRLTQLAGKVSPKVRFLSQSLATLLVWLLLAGNALATPGASADVSSLPGPTHVAANIVHLEMQPSTPWVKPGEEVTYAIYAEPGTTGTSAAQITLDYGKDLELVRIEPGPFLGDRTLPGPSKIDQQQGQATQVWARIGPTPASPGPGVLAYVTFRVGEGPSWNTWARQQVTLVDANFVKSLESSFSFNIHVYDHLPPPRLVAPGTDLGSAAQQTGPNPVLSLRTLSPGTFKYRIELSRDEFESTLFSFDQTNLPSAWDQSEYHSGAIAEFTSPKTLGPGRYQWRAYAWVEEVSGWTPASRMAEFEVRAEPMGLSQIEPMVVKKLVNGVTTIRADGWGFSKGITASLLAPQGPAVPARVRRLSGSRIEITAGPGLRPGLNALKIWRPDGQALPSAVLVLPPALFTARTHLPWAQQIVAGREFAVQTAIFNSGTAPDSVALVAVELPEPRYFELMSIEDHPRVEILDRDGRLVLMAIAQGAKVTFKFRLSTDLVALPGRAADHPVSLGTFLDFDFRAQVLAETSASRWNQLRSLSVARQVEVAQRETDESLRALARTFNDTPQEILEQGFFQLRDRGESAVALELVLRLQGHGLDTNRILPLIWATPDRQQRSLLQQHQSFLGTWP